MALPCRALAAVEAGLRWQACCAVPCLVLCWPHAVPCCAHPFPPQVTIVPREKHPLGQTVVKANEDRELTGLYTKRYLEEQLLTLLAGRAGQ